MNVVLSSKAAKYLEWLNEPIKGRIKVALEKLEHDPPKGDIKPMTGQEGYRLRIGKYRALLSIKADTIIVVDIGLRGQVYKGR